MKFITFLLVAVISLPSAKAQLKATPVCPTFSVDILEGYVNEKLDCISTSGQVQKLFPCFSEVVEETTGSACGGVFYKEKDIYFYTERDYIEIRDKFKGTLEPAVMGANRTSLFKLLGNPKLKDATWEAYQTKYGTLVVYFDANGKINKLQITNKSPDTLKLCE
jgi:hypothetical protein